MQIIGKDTFVIEMQEAVGFKNKQVMDDNEGLITVPDGEPEYRWMWFAGIGAHPTMHKVVGAVWTPYPAQAHQYKDRAEAEMINNKIIGPAGGGKVVSWKECHKEEGQQVIIPVINGEQSTHTRTT